MEENNKIQIVGQIISNPKFNHESHSEKFYITSFEVKRLSGDSDILELIISERLINIDELKIGKKLYVVGEIRTYNQYEEESNRRKLVVNIFVKSLREAESTDDFCMNTVELIGHVCKEPIYRKTPFDREITDLLIAVNRMYKKSDYLPCITWGRNAKYSSNLKVGEKVKLVGRMQSREYTKKDINGKETTKVAYEMSVITIEKLEEEIKEEK